MRETSSLAWAELQTSGQLTTARRVVYECLCVLGPMTAGELTRAMKHESESRPSYHKRLSELERQGCVETGKTRTCGVSGRDCIEWVAIPGVVPKPLKHASKSAERRILAAARNYCRKPTTLNKTELLFAALNLEKEHE